MQLTGSEIVIECLKEQGVDTVFGYPGGTILNIYDALYKHSSEIRHVLTSHEQGAAHAADGYARATGKVGVCMATSGPGATNLVTGIATAYMDSVRKAFHIARSGRPGPVLVDITKDVTAALCEYIPAKPRELERAGHFTQQEIEQVVELINQAGRPYIYLGGGAVISGASQEVARFAELVDAPVCDTLMGKGAFDGNSPRYTGMIGMHGTKTSNLGVSQCDLLIALGARFSDRVTGNPKKFAEEAKIIHIDIDAAEINKNIRVDASLIGDLKDVLAAINEKLEPQNHSDWMKRIQDLKSTYPLKYDKEGLSCPYVMEEIDRITKGEAIITTDVGQHQMWAAQYYHYTSPRTFLSSGGLGTMGYGLGACSGSAG